MTINLPPRRELPADIKERMRPHFTESAPRRTHVPLAVAAGVALLVAGGVAVTQSITDNDAHPARGRVLVPSNLDLDRCRAALGDQNWRSTEMVVFDGHKVLIGQDSRFCELTRSKAYVASTGAPVQLEAGTITYRSEKIVAGIPPLGALKARAREANGTYSRASTDAVVSPDFFVAYTPTQITVTELVFDDRTVPVPVNTPLPLATPSDSFESGNGDPTTADNRLARCLEASAPTNPKAAEPGWRAVVSAGFRPGSQGVVVARHDNDTGHYGVCQVYSDGSGAYLTVRELTDKAMNVGAITVYGSSPENHLVAGRTIEGARTIELSTSTTQPVTTNVVDGYFAAEIPFQTSTSPDTAVIPKITALVRGENNSVLYLGPLD